MEVKPHTSYEDQIRILRNRGCTINNEDTCLEILRNVNYYRLTAYFLPFKKDDNTYCENTSIERIYCIYEFDRKTRLLMLKILEEIEIKLRTSIAYTFAEKYGPLGYLDKGNFNKYHDHEHFISLFKSEIKKIETFLL